jgi:hypothetical protein
VGVNFFGDLDSVFFVQRFPMLDYQVEARSPIPVANDYRRKAKFLSVM